MKHIFIHTVLRVHIIYIYMSVCVFYIITLGYINMYQWYAQ